MGGWGGGGGTGDGGANQKVVDIYCGGFGQLHLNY